MSGKRRWWLIVGTGLLAVIQVGAALRSFWLPPDLIAKISLIPPLEVVLSGLWALIFVAAAINLVRGGLWRSWTFWVYPAFVTYSVLRLLIFARADYDQTRHAFVIIAMLLILATCALVWQRRPMME